MLIRYSWNQRYLNETSSMLEILNQRLRELEGPRRPSMFQHTSSSGSVHSSNGGSIGYQSPQSLPPGPAAYRQPSVTAFNMTSYGEHGRAPQASPQYHYQEKPFPQPPVQPYVAHPQANYFQQASGQPFGFGGQATMQQYQYPVQSTAPGPQFANWTGYGGPSVPDTLDEENAVPPNSNPWNIDAK